VDADACPVKQEICRVARCHWLPGTLVAASGMRIPDDQRIALEVVGQGLDVADDWIVAHVEQEKEEGIEFQRVLPLLGFTKCRTLLVVTVFKIWLFPLPLRRILSEPSDGMSN